MDSEALEKIGRTINPPAKAAQTKKPNTDARSGALVQDEAARVFACDTSGACGPVGVPREFLPHGVVRSRTGVALSSNAMGLDYPTATVGTVGQITVMYDPALGAPGLTLAQQFLGVALRPYIDMEVFFGITGGAVTVVIAALNGQTDGNAGAYHYGCDFTSGGTLYLDATFSSTTINPLDLLVALFVAELSECFMGAQNKGWGCGYSNGEGLSRFLAEEETPWGTLNAFQTASAWVGAGYPDWVSHTELSDRNAISTGCAILYIYWMRSQGFSIAEITRAGGATLSANYQTLTGRLTAYSDFVAAARQVNVTSDNPWGRWLERIACAVDNSDGRLEVFAVGTNRAVFNNWQTAAHSGPWSGWNSLGGIVTSTPFTVDNSDGRLELFARGTDRALYHNWQTAPHAGPWSGWASLGGIITSDPCVVCNTDGRLEAFARGNDGALWHIWQTAPHAGPWSGWASLGGGLVSDPAVFVNSDGRIEVFVRGTDSALYHIWQQYPHAGPWSGWASLGGILLGDPEVIDNSDGRLEVFARGTDKALWHIWQTASHAGPWSGWASLGGIIESDPAVSINSDGRLEVFAMGTNGALFNIWQTAPHSGPWSGWNSLGGFLVDDTALG